MATGTVLGIAVKVGCSCTYDGADDAPWDAAGRQCVGEAWAWVHVGGKEVAGYGYGSVGVGGDVAWDGAGYNTIGDPRELMRALGHPHPEERDRALMARLGLPLPGAGVRALHGAALRSATGRWDRLVECMTGELVDLLPTEVDVPEPEQDGHEDEDEGAYA